MATLPGSTTADSTFVSSFPTYLIGFQEQYGANLDLSNQQLPPYLCLPGKDSWAVGSSSGSNRHRAHADHHRGRTFVLAISLWLTIAKYCYWCVCCRGRGQWRLKVTSSPTLSNPDAHSLRPSMYFVLGSSCTLGQAHSISSREPSCCAHKPTG